MVECTNLAGPKVRKQTIAGLRIPAWVYERFCTGREFAAAVLCSPPRKCHNDSYKPVLLNRGITGIDEPPPANVWM